MSNGLDLRMFPLTAPGMPQPGPALQAAADALGDESVYKMTKSKGELKRKEILQAGVGITSLVLNGLYDEAALAVADKRGRPTPVEMIPGHRWASPNILRGPRKTAQVMLIGKMPGRDEAQFKRNFCGPPGIFLKEQMLEAGFTKDELREMYVTNILRFLPPVKKDESIPAAWFAECRMWLEQELRLVRPDFVLLLGAEAVKAMLGKSATLKSVAGSVQEMRYRLNWSDDEPERWKTAKAVPVIHPAWVLREPGDQDNLAMGLKKFEMVVHGKDAPEVVDHRVLTTMAELEAVFAEMEADPYFQKHRLMSFDAEWHGRWPGNRGAYLRTIQFTWRPGTAICLRLTNPGGEVAFDVGVQKALDAVSEFFHRWKVRLIGHFLIADMEWTEYYGMNLLPLYEAPEKGRKGKTAAQLTKWEGGFDTAIAMHAVKETSELKLELCLARCLGIDRYDLALTRWKKQFCKDKDITQDELEGYGECPSEILEPYANWDVDGTFRLFIYLQKKLDADEFGLDSRGPFWIAMRAMPAILEINQTGLLIDRERADKLTEAFTTRVAQLRDQLREWAHWPKFNLNSHPQVREFFFGEQYNGKRNPDGTPKRLREEGARTLGFAPVQTTGKRPTQWEDLLMLGEDEEDYVAGTGKAVLEVLRRSDHPHKEQAGWLFASRVMSQVSKNFLRPPKRDDETGELMLNQYGEPRYDGGLIKYVNDDGRVRSRIWPTADTARWKSSSPNVQNWTKSREPDYKEFLGDRYLYPMRSILMAPPKHVLVEADYTGAELLGMAIMSGDETMLDHAVRSSLPEHHPNHYDIHAQICVRAFRLEGVEPTKAGLKKAGHGTLRDINKRILFGAAYGRGAPAIASELRQQGVEVSDKDAADILKMIFSTYPGLAAYFDTVARRASQERYTCGAFGRRRRVPRTTDRAKQKDYERIFKNFAIQNFVADAVNIACDNFRKFRRDCGDPDLFRIALQIHDALLFLVPEEKLAKFLDGTLKTCMIDQVPLYPVEPTGERIEGLGPYYFGYEVNCYRHWSEAMKAEELAALGVAL